MEAAIQSFINTGEPVSSGWLFREHDFGIRPAMIRHELELLSDAGYLEQPHHSSGRVPTDLGYEFFANHFIGANEARVSVGKLVRLLEKSAFSEFFGEISEDLGLAGAAKAEKNTYKGGIENLVGNFDWETPQEIKSVVLDFSALEEKMAKLANSFFSGDEPRIFVGKKSPVTKSECLSVIFGGYESGNKKVSIVAIGPKRMDYKKAINMFKGLSRK
ncbi:MAG: hypothetical protein AAB897_02540 [Patescibacteria group bacterium]